MYIISLVYKYKLHYGFNCSFVVSTVCKVLLYDFGFAYVAKIVPSMNYHRVVFYD